jgi:hypothetical protein
LILDATNYHLILCWSHFVISLKNFQTYATNFLLLVTYLVQNYNLYSRNVKPSGICSCLVVCLFLVGINCKNCGRKIFNGLTWLLIQWYPMFELY